jgi:putative endonuclease|tara:strand:- start:93 stop:329 length:237 start_codon:yes stop_codon:yes gene_type:complete
MKLSYVYILECADATFYTGVTSNLDKRIIEHHNGIHPESYTAKRRPLRLVFYAQFTDIQLAIMREKQIKNGQERRRKL